MPDLWVTSPILIPLPSPTLSQPITAGTSQRPVNPVSMISLGLETMSCVT